MAQRPGGGSGGNPSFDPEAARREQAVEQALSVANIHRRRGDLSGAWRALDDALVVAPESAAVFEMMGQLSLEEDNPEAALRSFNRALELEPGRSAAEVGAGKATLALQDRQAEALLADATTAPVIDDSVLADKKPSTAGWLSALLPGLGQMYALEFPRGVAFAVAAFLVWIPALPALFELVVGGMTRRGLGASPALVALGTLVMVALHGVAAWDAARLVRQLQDEEREWRALRG